MLKLVLFFLALPQLLAAQASIDLTRVSAAISRDWTGNGVRDSALLVENERSVDLYLIARQSDGSATVQHSPDFMWRNPTGLEGQPTLEMDDDTFPVLTVWNLVPTIDPVAWHSNVGITYRGGQWVIETFFYGSWSHTNAESDYYCTINFATGDIEKTGGFSTLPPQLVPVSEWQQFEHAKACAPWDDF